MVNTILFDLDNTLLDFDQAESIALTQTLLQLGIHPNEAIIRRYSELNLAQWKLLEQGKLSRNEVKTRRYRLLFDELGAACSAEKAAEIYESLLKVGHYFIDGAEELLCDLSPRYRLYIVTNGTAIVQKSRIKSAGLEKYLDGVFISEEIGFNKPSRDFFDHCFAQIPNIRRSDAMIIGDSLSSDIQGGINAGIQTVWFNPARLPNDSGILPDYEIYALEELGPLLDAYD
ncbi:YjjG family noncanonical pyrimidine nucleotidase [Oscillibacter sp. GMB15532]|uniref:YjjG family noncanonical pyrimidine nucleotidase n=1 Tax=Oscillibacter sp. GMB15532 TaxID=3230022 RepID=UPI0034DE85A8